MPEPPARRRGRGRALSARARIAGEPAALPAPYAALHAALASLLPPERLVTDPLRLLAWGTDASFYRLVPKIAVVVETEAEVVRVVAECARARLPLTFRAAGTSLSGQAISDSVLVLLGDGWRGCAPGADGATIALQPGVIGAVANRALAPYGRKIGPDPASIDAAMIGGIAANNASGMCCGTAQNSYRTLAGLRVVLADGAVVDTRDGASRAAFAASHGDLLRGLADLARATQADAALSARIRHKYRLKNTTGYSLNALVDFTDPFDVLAHLLIGSEGTLGFITEVALRLYGQPEAVAAATCAFATLKGAVDTVIQAIQLGVPVARIEFLDEMQVRLSNAYSNLGLPEAPHLFFEFHGSPTGVAEHAETVKALATENGGSQFHWAERPEDRARLWKARHNAYHSGKAWRPGATLWPSDVCVPIAALADAVLSVRADIDAHGLLAPIVGHVGDGNFHVQFLLDPDNPTEREAAEGVYARMIDRAIASGGTCTGEHGIGLMKQKHLLREAGEGAVATMKALKRALDPKGLMNPGKVLP